MRSTRRQFIGNAAAAGAAALLPSGAIAQKGRQLNVIIQGFSLAIHMPQVIALREGMPELGYAPPKIDRIESMQVITQSIVAGSAEAGDADVVSAMRASEVGANVTHDRHGLQQHQPGVRGERRQDQVLRRLQESRATRSR